MNCGGTCSKTFLWVSFNNHRVSLELDFFSGRGERDHGVKIRIILLSF